MTIALQFVFWLALGLVGYVYVGYPLLLVLADRLGLRFGPKRESESSSSGPLPSVSVLVAAYNEEAVIAAKVQNLLEAGYQASIEVIVASDGSSDRTNEIVSAITDQRVRLLDLPRGGKTCALNAAAAVATGEVLVMTDATTHLAPGTLEALVAPFADPKVGCVGAELEYVSEDGSAVGKGTSAYWRYEKKLKSLEAKVCSLIGCSGALYAARAAAHRPIHPELDDDFTMSWQVFEQGYFTAYARGAVSSEATNEDEAADFRMRVRVVIRAVNALWKNRRFWNPLRYGWFALQLVSHKVLRYAVPWFLAVALVLHVAILADGTAHPAYAALAVGHLGIYACAMIGKFSIARDWKIPLVHIPFYFMHVNIAALVGSAKFLIGNRAVTWDTAR
ncbi:MAG: cellulose synthase/poly-beta-1,6-N-acetylglucosamine synthase-like glycosyltransferase [Bradymonadia bacterium]|jgi:cellulose synthase/poly-beta-1,6-N-acetylglucosamine synthase-like glycosyltransferase